MTILRSISNLHRGMKLLKQIVKQKGKDDLDAVVEDAVIHAEDLGGKISALSKENKKTSQEMERKINREILHLRKGIDDSNKSIEKNISAFSEDQKNIVHSFIQEIKAGNNTISKELASASHNTLEIAEQVKVLRDYIASQQEQVVKLQKGYDWTVIRNFATRIIRCVDRIQDDIDRYEEKDSDFIEHLSLIREELLIALEDSGMEIFTPKEGVEYKGHEQMAKVIQTKKVETPDDGGKIFRTIRPGFFFRIDSEKKSIIRPAEVEISVYEKEVGPNE